MSLANFIKTILNIQDDNISFPEEDYCQIIQKGNYVIKVFKGFLKSNYCSCPHCNSRNIVKNGSRKRNIKFIPFQNYNVELNLSIQRHICKDCKKTFSPSTSILLLVLLKIILIFLITLNTLLCKNFKKIFLLLLLLRSTIFLFLQFKESWMSVTLILRLIKTIYLKLCVLMSLNQLKILMVLCLLFLLINQTKNIIDIIEDRRLNSLTEYFSRFSLEAKNNIKYICMDMYSPYISLVKSIFPKSEIVLDKFHIVNLVSRAFNQTRISIMNSLKDDSLKRKLKLFWKLLQKYYPDLCQEPYYCQSFKYKLSTKEKVDYLLEKSPELDINFNIYQDILQSIRHNNFKRFENIVKKNLAKKEKVSKQMLTALKTLKKYMKYIENMFKSNITNGLIEGLNNKIKSIKRTAFGYSNFSNFKKHILIQARIISISA